MSNGEDEDTTTDADEAGGELATTESLTDRCEKAENALETAETEADLDDVEALINAIEADLETAELPEPDDEDEDDPREQVESQVAELREGLEAARGPYAEDVIEAIETAKTTIAEGEWTDQGKNEVVEAVTDFQRGVETSYDGAIDEFTDDVAAIDEAADALDDVAATINTTDLDPDEDAEILAALVETTETLHDDLEAAQEWEDLTVREQLQAEGYYNVLGHIKDYPPEWAALKEHEKRGNTAMILLAFDSLDSDFMEEHCLEALTRMGPIGATDEAVEAMLALAGKRKKDPITILGKMGTPEAVETLLEYVDADKDPALQKVTFRALGEIGDEQAVQPLADKLLMDNDNVRPHAARALGLIGDTRAIKPLSESLKADDNASVRAQAAWALRQIGTKRALEAVVDHGSDETFIVQTEIDKARRALDAAVPSA